MPDAGDTPRLAALRKWATSRHALASPARLELVAGDASFRRYFRLWLDDERTRIVMDAPPDKEDSRPFVTIAETWQRAGLPVPVVHAVDLEAGFIELDDLGDTPLHLCLGEAENADTLAWHAQALQLLDTLQHRAPVSDLPAYDAALLGRELDLFPAWCLTRMLAIPAPPCWPEVRQRLIDVALEQPRVAVHRDFDAMNLMRHDGHLWLIDFQDAVYGPLTYDLISLLRGRYWRFSQTRYSDWLDAFRRRAIADGRLGTDIDEQAFRYMADCMAAQRALKVLGIFCRLTLRDGKAGYLARLPHFLAHLRDSLLPWPEFADLLAWLDERFSPALQRALVQRDIPGATP